MEWAQPAEILRARLFQRDVIADDADDVRLLLHRICEITGLRHEYWESHVSTGIVTQIRLACIRERQTFLTAVENMPRMWKSRAKLRPGSAPGQPIPIERADALGIPPAKTRINCSTIAPSQMPRIMFFFGCSNFANA